MKLLNLFHNLTLKEDYGIHTDSMADLPRKDLGPLHPNSEKSSCLLLTLCHTHMQTIYGLNTLQTDNCRCIALSWDSVVLDVIC